jgi:hypothetical protein
VSRIDVLQHPAHAVPRKRHLMVIFKLRSSKGLRMSLAATGVLSLQPSNNEAVGRDSKFTISP